MRETFPKRYSSLISLLPNVRFKFKTKTPQLWLTFDDGPVHTTTIQTLDLLSEHQVQATFFLLMDRSVGNQQLIRTIRSNGHEIGLHGWHHKKQLFRNPKQSLQEWLDMKYRIEEILGEKVRRFRAPYGCPPIWIWNSLTEIQLEPVWMSWYIGDYRKEVQTNRVINSLITDLEYGDILLFHDGSPYPMIFVDMLRLFLMQIRKDNWEFVIPK